MPNFHLAFPVFDLEATRHFYTKILGCRQGRESVGQWIDFDLFGHQIVSHKIPHHLHESFRKSRQDLANMVDGQNVPIPHFGLVLKWDVFDDFSTHLKQAGIKFKIEPYTRFEGKVGEQKTMVFIEFNSSFWIQAEILWNSRVLRI